MTTPATRFVFIFADGGRAPITVGQKLQGVRVSAPVRWDGTAPAMPEDWEGYDNDPEICHFEHAQGEPMPRPVTTVAAIQELGLAYNEVEGAMRWVKMELEPVPAEDA